MSEEVINIGKRREVFWDETLVDEENTSTTFKLHEPVQRECVVTEDEPWAGGTSPYMTVLPDGDIYRMYTAGDHGAIYYCESRDGIHWEKPNLGIYEFNGSKDNNICTANELGGFDGFRPFVDTNPNCLPEERIKAVANCHDGLRLYVSENGTNFKPKGYIRVKGHFDSVNTVFFNNQTGTYQCFVRDFHPSGDPSYSIWTRDIRFSECDSLLDKYWPEPKQLRYDSMTDWQMYINSVMKYYRADHVYIGFPSRYVQRPQWTENYDELCGVDARRERVKTMDPRHGLAVSDTLFMTSRDGLHWKRYNEVFLRPGPEHLTNWVYGSVYFSNGIVETAPTHPECDREISFYCTENRWFNDMPTQVYRYSIRKDGFVSIHGQYPEATMTTKPLIFEGTDMFINFATSAYGHCTITIKEIETGRTIKADGLFGDSTDRHVRFNGDLASFAGKPVVISFHMCDADLYSMIFQ